MPQSPRWLVMAGRDFEARAVLARVRSGDPETIEQEILEIKDEVKAKPGTWADLRRPVIKAALVVGVGLAILQQVSGINTVIYYAPTIIQDTGVDSSAAAILASVAVGIVNVGMTFVAIRLLDRARAAATAARRQRRDGDRPGRALARLHHRRRQRRPDR